MRPTPTITALTMILTLACAAIAAPGPNLSWLKTHSGPGNLRDEATIVVIDDDNGGAIFVAGSAYSRESSDDFMILKYAPSGRLEWEAIYDGPRSHVDELSSIALDGAGGLYATGLSTDLTGRYLIVLHLNSVGGIKLLHSRLIEARYSVRFSPQIAIDPDDNLVICGHELGDYLTLKLDSAGELLWARRYDATPGADDTATDIVCDALGAVYVSGFCGGNGYTTVSYDASGELRWAQHEFGPIGGVLGPALLGIDPFGDLVVAATPESTCGIHQARVWKLSAADGMPLWIRFAPENRCDQIKMTDMVIANDGSVVVTGSGRLASTSDYTLYTLKWSSSGEALWERTHNRAGGGTERGGAVAVDEMGSVYITGGESAEPTTTDFITISYNAAGFRRWAVRHIDPTGSERGRGIAVGRDGSVVVVGALYIPKENSDFAAFRYEQRTALPATPKR